MTDPLQPPAPEQPSAAGTPAEVFAVFLRLGLSAFGGPIAHLAYFRHEFVTRRGWLSERAYADLIALCQFLPGPASSQAGFAIGLIRGGWLGALAAFAGFTLPSAAVMIGSALLIAGPAGPGGPLWDGLLHGLKITAAAVVAQAVWGMARSLCPDRPRATIAAAAMAALAAVPGPAGMLLAIALGVLAGLLTGPAPGSAAAEAGPAAIAMPVTRRQAMLAGALFAALLLSLPLLSPFLDGFYRAGALVLGGGHVVLPLLKAAVVDSGAVGADAFMAGYGVAQAVPGPLFTFAAYLGAAMQTGPGGIAGGLIAMLALFLPGFLLLIAALPFWQQLRAMPRAQAALQGANAAVVGILGAALYAPVMTTAIRAPGDAALAVALFVALTVWRLPPWVCVALGALGGVGLGLAA